MDEGQAVKRTSLPRRALDRIGVRKTVPASRRGEIQELDRLCRQLIFLRDHETCQRTGSKKRLQWCHVFSRGIHSLRWEPDNSLVLSAGSHLKAHLQPLEFSRWFEETHPDRAAHLRLLRQTKRRVDRGALRLWLEAELVKCHRS